MKFTTVTIDGKEMRMGASALIPRLYRVQFDRDLMSDMSKLASKLDAKDSLEKQFSALDLTIFENVAWLMLKQAGENVGNSPDEWLDTIDGVFSIYEILPQILDLWSLTNLTTSKPRKK